MGNDNGNNVPKGFTINEYGEVVRGGSNTPRPKNNGGDNGPWFWIGLVVAIILVFITVIVSNQGTSSNSNHGDPGVSGQIHRELEDPVVDDNYFSISSTSVSIEGEGGSRTFTVSSSSPWEISVQPESWGSLSRDGDELTLTVDANNSSESRTDYFEIISNEKKIRIDISQEKSPINASIEEVWVDHNVYDEYGNRGMRIHVKFKVNGMHHKKGEVYAMFYYANGSPLKDYNSNYCDGDDVATWEDFTPGYASTVYSDFDLFIPYDEFHLDSSASCFFRVSVWNGNDKLAESASNTFNYTVN